MGPFKGKQTNTPANLVSALSHQEQCGIPLTILKKRPATRPIAFYTVMSHKAIPHRARVETNTLANSKKRPYSPRAGIRGKILDAGGGSLTAWFNPRRRDGRSDKAIGRRVDVGRPRWIGLPCRSVFHPAHCQSNATFHSARPPLPPEGSTSFQWSSSHVDPEAARISLESQPNHGRPVQKNCQPGSLRAHTRPGGVRFPRN